MVKCLTQQAEKQEEFSSTVLSLSEDKMQGIWVATVLNLDYPISPTDSETDLRDQTDAILNLSSRKFVVLHYSALWGIVGGHCTLKAL